MTCSYMDGHLWSVSVHLFLVCPFLFVSVRFRPDNHILCQGLTSVTSPSDIPGPVSKNCCHRVFKLAFQPCASQTKNGR